MDSTRLAASANLTTIVTRPVYDRLHAMSRSGPRGYPEPANRTLIRRALLFQFSNELFSYRQTLNVVGSLISLDDLRIS